MEGIESQELESDLDQTAAQKFARVILQDPSLWGEQLSTTQLAAACAQLDVELDIDTAELGARKAALTEARRVLADRFSAEGVSQVRVTTTEGRRLVHLASVFVPSVLAANRPKVLAWLKEHHPELVAEQYNDASFKAKLKAWQADGEGDFPQELVTDGTIKVFTGVEVRFRNSK